MKPYIKLAFLAITLSSCETLVDDLPLSRFPELKSKLVLTSFIAPTDSLITVTLGESTPLFGEYGKTRTEKVVNQAGDTLYYNFIDRNNIVTDAQVTISNGTLHKNLTYNAKTKKYELPTRQFAIIPGQTYTIVAQNNIYSVKASTTVPLQTIEAQNIKLDSLTENIRTIRIDSTGKYVQVIEASKVWKLDFDWKDPAGQKNYYKIDATIRYDFEIPTLENQKVVYKKQSHYLQFAWDSKYLEFEKKFKTDSDLDGRQIKSPKGNLYQSNMFNTQNSFTINGTSYPIRTINNGKQISLKLYHLNEDYYQNQLTLLKLYSSGGGETPFTEPTQIYSNVSNGLGCFAAYTVSEHIINKY
jgi:hypothetical protein